MKRGMKYEKCEQIFKKYITEDSLSLEYICDDLWDCCIEFKKEMLDELGIEYEEKNTEYINYLKTTNHSTEGDAMVFLIEEGITWVWAIISNGFKRNRKKVGEYFISDSESGGNMNYSYRTLSRHLKTYLTPMLDKIVSEFDFKMN